MTSSTHDGGSDAVQLFEKHRSELRRARLGTTLLLGAIFVFVLLTSAHISNFYPQRLLEGLPRIFEYFGTIMPSLDWNLLFEPRDDNGNAVQGSLTYWYTDIGLYLQLLGETLLMALTATILGAAAAFLMSFPASRNLMKNTTIYWIARRFMEVCRGVPEILIALVFVFAYGIGPLAGILAIAIHSAGALGKLFSEVNENASLKPAEGIRASGGNWFEEIRYAIVPQVLPNFTSYMLLRFEINVRASSIVGFVGAGGIGQELNKTISFYNDDRVLAVLILIILMVTVIDLISERARLHFIGRENFQ